MAKVEIKQPIVDEIAGYLADAQAMVLVDYRWSDSRRRYTAS